MADVWEINDIDQLASRRGTWNELLAGTPGASFFQTLEWLEAYWRHYGEAQRLRVLFVGSGGRTVGILPLVVRTEATKVGNVRFLTYPLDYWGSFYGPIGPEPEQTLSAGLDYLRRAKRDWQVFELRWIDHDHFDGGRTERALQAAELHASRTTFDCTYCIDLAGSFADYLASRTSKWRNNYKRWERQIAADGEVSLVRYRPQGEPHDADPRWDLYDTCEEISRRSWQGASTTGTTLCSESIRRYLRDVHAVAARRGGLDLNLLHIGGRPVAFAYNYFLHGLVFGLRVGFDRELANRGAGNVLYVRAIEDSFRRGDKVYDFGPGSYEAKRQLFTRESPLYRFTHCAPLDVRSQMIRVKRWYDEKRFVGHKQPDA